MNKGIGALIVGILAVIGGAAFAALLIKNKLAKKKDDVDFDDFDNAVDDEEFEHFFGDEDETAPEVEETSAEEATSEEAPVADLEEDDTEAEEQL